MWSNPTFLLLFICTVAIHPFPVSEKCRNQTLNCPRRHWNCGRSCELTKARCHKRRRKSLWINSCLLSKSRIKRHYPAICGIITCVQLFCIASLAEVVCVCSRHIAGVAMLLERRYCVAERSDIRRRQGRHRGAFEEPVFKESSIENIEIRVLILRACFVKTAWCNLFCLFLTKVQVAKRSYHKAICRGCAEIDSKKGVLRCHWICLQHVRQQGTENFSGASVVRKFIQHC